MRAFVAAGALVLALAGVVAGEPSPDPYSYALAHGCRYVHPSAESYRQTTRLLKHERPVGPRVKRRVRKWARCVQTRAKAHAVHEHVRGLWAWRHEYTHLWPIRFNSQPAGWRWWGDATAWCESGGTMDPGIHNDGGQYHGLMQFDLRTWGEAGGSGDPHVASRWEQETRGIWLARRVGKGRWPNCP